MLAQLASHYWRPDFSPAQAASLAADYCEDLAACRLDEIEVAIREYRLDSSKKFFPKSSDLRDIVFANRKHREELARLGNAVKIDSRPIMWWTLPPYLWKPHWQESEIPEAHRATFEAILKAKRAAGDPYWQVENFAGLARKQQAEAA